MVTKVEIFTIPLGIDQCYVIRSDGVIAVDAGAPKKGKTFARALELLEIEPRDVQLVVLTHGHWDHIGSANEIKSLSGATIAMHRSDVQLQKDSHTQLPPGITPWGTILGALLRGFKPFIKVPTPQVDLMFDNDGLSLEDFGIPGRIVHTPGHSPGSVSVLLDSGEAFVGDLAMNGLPLRLSPGMPIFADDPSAVISSWKSLIELGATIIYPAHGKPFTVSVLKDTISRMETDT